MYGITPDEQGKPSKGSGVYVTYTDVDRNFYKAGAIKLISGSDKTYEHTYTVTKDLKIPSREKHLEAVNTVLEKHPEYVRDAAESYIQQLYGKKNFSEMPKEKYKQEVNELVREYDTMSKEERAFRVAQGFRLADEFRTETIKELSKSGYNAMADEATIGGRHGYSKSAYDALIVFDNDSLNKTSNKLISRKNEVKSRTKDWEWYRKVNSQMGKEW